MREQEIRIERRKILAKKISLLLCATLCVLLCFFSCKTVSKAAETDSDTMRIVLDPGHGGDDSGANNEETGILEKNLNLKIGLYLKEELEKYENVEVFMTRDSDRKVELDDRTDYSVEKEADLMVSLHNNATGPMAPYDHGCTVLTSEGLYRPEIGQEEDELAVCILQELKGLGLEDQGILHRESQDGGTYENGAIADYYRLVRNGVNNKIPTIIVEHAFLDHSEDYENYLSDDEKLKSLAQADARGIARYYQLKLKEDGSTLEPLTNTEEKIVLTIDEDYRDNTVSNKTFFATDGGKNMSSGNASSEEEEIIKEIISRLTDELIGLDIR